MKGYPDRDLTDSHGQWEREKSSARATYFVLKENPGDIYKPATYPEPDKPISASSTGRIKLLEHIKG